MTRVNYFRAALRQTSSNDRGSPMFLAIHRELQAYDPVFRNSSGSGGGGTMIISDQSSYHSSASRARLRWADFAAHVAPTLGPS